MSFQAENSWGTKKKDKTINELIFFSQSFTKLFNKVILIVLILGIVNSYYSSFYKLHTDWRTKEMDMVTRVQILDETTCISHGTNTLGKGMNPIIHFFA